MQAYAETASGATNTSPRRKYETSRRMAVNYTRDQGAHAPAAGRRGPAIRPTVAWLFAVTSLQACASGGSPLRAPPLAPGSTPEPVRYEVVVPGGRLDVRERLLRELSDSLFHVNPS